MIVGKLIRVQWLPTKDGTLVSHEQLLFHSILLKISDNANFKCWSVLRQKLLYFLKSVYFISNIISCFTSFIKKKEIMYCINICKVDVFVLF